MIGCAAAIYLLVNGRVMGTSGILGGLIDGTGRANLLERLAFLAGLIAAPALVVFLTWGDPGTSATTHPAILILAGLLVGYGTRLGGGCTSGHGVCGLSRLSKRSIIATALFMASGVLTLFVARHLLGIV